MVVLVMGVSGVGKSTIGARLAAALGARFVEGDDLHTAAAVAKMRRGAPLADADRLPWLDRIRALIDDALARDESVVVACSALTRVHRARLGLPRAGVQVVLLHGTEPQLRARLQARQGHFVHDELLTSQLALLEPPDDAIAIGVDATPADIVERLLTALSRRP